MTTIKTNPKHYEIKVNLQKLTALKLLAGDQDLRYYLNGVCVEATTSQTRLLATNGHMAGMASEGGYKDQGNVMADGFVTFVVPNEVIDKINWKPNKLAALGIIYVDTWQYPTGDSVDAPLETSMLCVLETVDGSRYPFSALEGRYPDIRRVMPWALVEEQGQGAQLNTNYVARFQKFSKVYAGNKDGVVRLGYAGADKVVQVLIPNQPDFIGCIMPMKDSDLTPPARWPAQGADEGVSDATA